MAVIEVCGCCCSSCCCSVLLTSGLDSIGAPSTTKKAREINMAIERSLRSTECIVNNESMTRGQQ